MNTTPHPLLINHVARSCAWLSVLIKCGNKVIQPRIAVKCDWDDPFKRLAEGRVISKVQISNFIDPEESLLHLQH